MQDQDLAQAVAQELSEKSDILTHYKKKPSDNTYGKLFKVAHFLR
jgi:iron uptake system EfeUOB component EfeO/EfeM